MMDIDYCKGENCSMEDLCQRYKDYLWRKSHNQDTNYSLSPNLKEEGKGGCDRFLAVPFCGD